MDTEAMMMTRVLAFLLTTLFYVGAVHAGNIYICKGEHGVNSYQNTPCATAAKQIRHDTYDDALARPSTPPIAAEVSYGNGSGLHGYRRVGEPRNVPPPTVASPKSGRDFTGGLGSSAYQRGEVQGTRCVSARGQVYYTAGSCGSTTQLVGTQERDWHGDTVQGLPGAVMVGPDLAVDPRTGRTVELDHRSSQTSVYRTTQDQGASMDVDQACVEAQKLSTQHPFSRQAQHRVDELCRSGRSLYDTKPSANSLYGGG